MGKILFLSQLVPYPPDAGPKVRSYYLLRYLAQKHAVTLLAFSRPDDTQAALHHLREFCAAVHVVPMHRSRGRDLLTLASSFLRGKSFIIKRDYVPEMAAAVDQLLQSEQFDAVHSDQLWMAQYALRALRSTLQPPFAGSDPGHSSIHQPANGTTCNLQLILDEHNACFQIFQRLAAGERNPLNRLLLEREWKKLRAYEAKACARFDHVVTVTEEDRAILQDLIAVEKERTGRPVTGDASPAMRTIPICVDTDAINPVTPVPGSQDVLHLGTMFWLPNVEGVLWFARQVWPKVIARIPQASFTIVGKNPPAEIQALSTDENGDSAIRVTGYVPDPQPYLERAGVFIVPLLSGGGMRVKIVDGWRWGLPIVSTSIGAEGIRCRPGENLLLADNAEDFAQAVIRVLQEPGLAGRLRVNGRQWVEEHYNWRTVYTAWDSLYAC